MRQRLEKVECRVLLKSSIGLGLVLPSVLLPFDAQGYQNAILFATKIISNCTPCTTGNLQHKAGTGWFPGRRRALLVRECLQGPGALKGA